MPELFFKLAGIKVWTKWKASQSFRFTALPISSNRHAQKFISHCKGHPMVPGDLDLQQGCSVMRSLVFHCLLELHKVFLQNHGRSTSQILGAFSILMARVIISLLCGELHSIQSGFAKKLQHLSTPLQSWNPGELLQNP